MDYEYDIGDKVIKIEDDKVNDLEEKIVSEIKSRPTPLAMSAAMPLVQEAAQPLLISHDYRNIKVSEGITVTIDVEEIKRQLEKSFYPPIGLDHGT